MFRSLKSRLRRDQDKSQEKAATSEFDEEELGDASKKKYHNNDKQKPLIRNASLELLKAVRRSIYCCCGFWITTFVIASLVVVYGHHVLCIFHKAFCTPLSEYIYRFPMLPMANDSVLSNVDAIKDPIHCDRFKKYAETYPDGKQLLFLIGESRGGSTFTYDTLDLHSNIMMRGGEPLYSFANEVCNNNPILRDLEKCTFDNWLHALYDNSFYQHKSFFQTSDTQHKLFGTKINIEQIPSDFHSDLGEFLHCTRRTSVVVHVTRAASIASFLNYQAEVPERINSADLTFRGNKVPRPLNQPLKLDPHLAAEWVNQRDMLSREIFYRLAFSVSAKYTHFYYEQLHGEFAEAHWNSLFGFLGLQPISITEERTKRASSIQGKRTANKTHGSIPCSQRIANWEEVKSALNGTLSALACEKAS
jgi:hypothetical protein